MQKRHKNQEMCLTEASSTTICVVTAFVEVVNNRLGFMVWDWIDGGPLLTMVVMPLLEPVEVVAVAVTKVWWSKAL